MLHTRICDLLGIEHPIINAPMAGTATAALAAAVSAAGGFSLIGGSAPTVPSASASSPTIRGWTRSCASR